MPLTQAEAQYIFNNTLGCRYGTTTAGAAYAFMDIVGAGQDGNDPPPPVATVLQWLQNPQAPAFQPRWDARLWNTCGVIIGLSAAGTVILVSQASPTAERYLFGSPLAQGDGYSFRKNNRLPSNSQILATINYGLGDPAPEEEDPQPPTDTSNVTSEQVQDLYNKIMAALAKLA